MSAQTELRTGYSRDGTADLLKGAAVLFMILVHLFENFVHAELMVSEIGSVAFFLGGLPAAPVFMVVMGYYLGASRKGVLKQVTRGLGIIVLGFLLNLIRSAVFLIDGTPTQVEFLQIVFGVDILPLAGLSILLLGLIQASKHRFAITTAAIPFVLLIHEMLSLLPDASGSASYLQAFFYGSLSWSYFPFFPWFLYPLSGYWVFLMIQRYKEVFTSTVMENCALVAGIIVTATFSYGWKISIHLPYYYHHEWVYFLWGMLFLMAYVWFTHRLNAGFGEGMLLKLIKWVGKHVTAFYIVQWVLIGNLAYWLYRTMNLEETLISFVGITVSSAGIVYLWEKVRAGFVTGPQKQH